MIVIAIIVTCYLASHWINTFSAAVCIIFFSHAALIYYDFNILVCNLKGIVFEHLTMSVSDDMRHKVQPRWFQFP